MASTSPLSLRAFHLVFLLCAIVGADLFGVWAIRDYRTSGDVLILVLGIVTLLGGLGLIVYTIYVVRKLDQANVH